MAVVILIKDVNDFCAESEGLSDIAVQVYIDMVSDADACLDASLVSDVVQRFLKLNAVCHYITKANGGQVKSETDMDGASVSFESYRIDGYGLASTTFGQAILSTGNTCFEFMNKTPNRFIRSFGR